MKVADITKAALACAVLALLAACGSGGGGDGGESSSVNQSSSSLTSSAASSQSSSATASSSSAAQEEEVTYTQVDQKQFVGDGTIKVVTEELSVEANETLLPDYGEILFTRRTASGGVADSLKNDFMLKSDFYKVEAAGEADSVGRVSLRFNSTDPSDRLVYILDGKSVGMLDTEPSDGVLKVDIRVPAKRGTSVPNSTLGVDAEITYAVVGAKAGAAAASEARAGVSGPHYCVLQGSIPYVDYRCRSNSGTVDVHWGSDKNITVAVADQVVDFFEQSFADYKALGINAADLSKSWWGPQKVYISDRGSSASYKPGSGAIYLPEDLAQSITSLSVEAKSTILHELGHSLEDEEYPMLLNYWSNSETWWLETATENLTFLVNTDMIANSIDQYGTSGRLGDRYGTQLAPLGWDDESYYIHAQLVRFNMCDDPIVCPISRSDFIAAINEGTYPFADTGRLNKLLGNTYQYSRYVLGLASKTPFTAQPPSNVKDYFKLGDFVVGTQDSNGNFKFEQYGYDRTKVAVEDGRDVVNVSTKIDKGGVYRLTIANDGTKDTPTPIPQSWPLALNIEAGAPAVSFVYNDDGVETYHTSGEAVTIQPISKGLADISNVKVAVAGQTGAVDFKAQVSIIDLSGDINVTKATLVSSTVTSTNPETEIDAQGLVDVFTASMFTTMAQQGTYVYKSGTAQNIFTYKGGEVEEGVSEYFDGSQIILSPDKVEVTLEIDYIAPEGAPPAWLKHHARSAGTGAGSDLLIAASLTPFLFAALFRRRRLVSMGIAGIGAAALLTSCVGLQEFDDHTYLTFGKIAYIGKPGDDRSPQWHLSQGEGTSLINIVVVSTEEDDQGNEYEVTETIAGELTYTLEADIYKDGVIVEEED